MLSVSRVVSFGPGTGWFPLARGPGDGDHLITKPLADQAAHGQVQPEQDGKAFQRQPGRP